MYIFYQFIIKITFYYEIIIKIIIKKMKIVNCDLGITIHNGKRYEWSKYILQKEKKFEGRIPREGSKWASLEIGDTLIFNLENGSVIKSRISNILKFKNFGEAFEKLGTELGPFDSIDEANDAYSFFSQEDIERFGMIAIQIELI